MMNNFFLAKVNLSIAPCNSLWPATSFIVGETCAIINERKSQQSLLKHVQGLISDTWIKYS